MKKNELIEAIKQTGTYVSTKLTKDELEQIYSKLHVHREKTPNLEPEEDDNISVPLPDEKEMESQQEETKPPEEKPQVDEMADLMGKIEGAKAPEPKTPEDKPLFEKTARRKKKGESSSESFRIEGYILLLVTDTIFPFTLAWINNMLDKKIKVDAADLQLSEKDFNKLEPLADQAADYMSINLNPIAGFFLVSTFMYSNNLIVVRMQKDR